MLQKLTIWLFQLLFFTVPLFFATNTDELFEFNKMILTYLLTIAIVTVWLLRMVMERRWLVKRTPFDLPICLFLLSQLLSTLFSIHPQTSIFGYYSRFHGGLLSTISYVALFYAFVSTVEKPQLKQLFFSLFSAGLLVSLYGIAEHFGHSPSCLLITGNFDVSCWIQDVQARVFATFGQPNWLAAYVVTLLPLGFILSVSSKYPPLRAFYSLTTLAMFAVLLFTQSRSGILGFGASAVVLAIGAWYYYRKGAVSALQIHKTSLVSLVVGLTLLALLFGTPYTPSISSLSTKQITNEIDRNVDNMPVNRLEQGGSDSGEIRKIVWTGALDIWQRYPLFGSGVETFAYSYYQDRPLAHNLVSEWDFLYNKAHNEYLNFLATTGIVGLTTYLLLQVWVCLYTLKQIHTTSKASQVELLAAALLAGYGALSISNFFGFSTVMVGILFFIIPAILTVLYTSALSRLDTKIEAENLQTYIFTAVIGVLAMTVVANTIQYWRADVLFTRGKTYLGAREYETGFTLLQTAIQKNSSEGLYYDTLADSYAQVALQLSDQNEATAAAEVSTAAIALSQRALELNPVHLNFHKTKIRIFITLASIDLQYLNQAEQATKTALELAPTDAKLHFTLAQILKAEGKTAEAIESLEKTIELKPDYESAYQVLAETYLEIGQPEQAAATATYILESINPDNVRAQELATYSASSVN